MFRGDISKIEDKTIYVKTKDEDPIWAKVEFSKPGLTVILARNAAGKSILAKILASIVIRSDLFADYIMSGKYPPNDQEPVVEVEVKVVGEDNREVNKADAISSIIDSQILITFGQEKDWLGECRLTSGLRRYAPGELYHAIVSFVDEYIFAKTTDLLRRAETLYVTGETYMKLHDVIWPPTSFIDKLIKCTKEYISKVSQEYGKLIEILERKEKAIEIFSGGGTVEKKTDAHRKLERLNNRRESLLKELDKVRREIEKYVDESKINNIYNEIQNRQRELSVLEEKYSEYKKAIDQVSNEIGVNWTSDRDLFEERIVERIKEINRQIPELIQKKERIEQVKNIANNISSKTAEVMNNIYKKISFNTEAKLILSEFKKIEDNLKDISKSIADEISKIKDSNISPIQLLCIELGIECKNIEVFNLTVSNLIDVSNKLSEAIGGYMSDLSSLIKTTQNFINKVSTIRESKHFKIINDDLKTLLQDIDRIKNEAETKLGIISKEITDKTNRIEQLNRALKYLSEINTLNDNIKKLREEIEKLREEYNKLVESKIPDDLRMELKRNESDLLREIDEIDEQIRKTREELEEEESEYLQDLKLLKDSINEMKKYVKGSEYLKGYTAKIDKKTKSMLVHPAVLSTSAFNTYLILNAIAYNYIVNRYLADYIEATWGKRYKIPLVIDISAAYDKEYFDRILELLYRYALEAGVRIYVMYPATKNTVIEIESKDQLNTIKKIL